MKSDLIMYFFTHSSSMLNLINTKGETEWSAGDERTVASMGIILESVLLLLLLSVFAFDTNALWLKQLVYS